MSQYLSRQAGPSGAPTFAVARRPVIPPGIIPDDKPLGDVFSDVTGTLQTINDQIAQISAIRENTDKIRAWMPWATGGLFFVGSGLVVLAFMKRR